MMFTLTKALEKALLQHFIYMKVDIAYAINKPFPFFEALRDKSFITERMYKESLEACLNLVPLSKVVHYILTSLEQSFHPSVLLTLFSKVNLREYPSLVAIFRSFRKVGYTYEEKNRPPLTLLEDLANPAEGCSLQTLLPPPRPQISLPSHLSSAPRVCDPRATAQPIIEILDEQPSPSPRGCASPWLHSGRKNHSRDHQRKDKEDSREMPHSPSGPESVVKDDSPAANDLAMAQEVPCTPANKKGAKPALKTMNSSSEHCNISDWLRLEATVKAFVYVVAFSITTSLTFVIIAIVSQSLQLRKEVRLVLLCHHLLCISSYCGLGVIFQGMLALLAKSPLLLCLLVFGAQLSVGEGILLTLTLMALNTYLAICYPLNSPSFVDSAKYRILAGTWTTVILKNVGLFLIEGTSPTPASVFQSAPLCPVILNGMPARVIGMFSLAFLLSVILVSYCLIYREGKRAGHFNKSNIKARRTVLVHLLQICLHVIPTLIIIGLGKQCGVFFFALNLALFGIFAFAQCFNPLVYGLHNRDLQSKLYPWLCCRKKLLP